MCAEMRAGGQTRWRVHRRDTRTDSETQHMPARGLHRHTCVLVCTVTHTQTQSCVRTHVLLLLPGMVLFRLRTTL